ncbi:MAG: cell division protein FtsQ/DivIB [Kiloniellales bacterium]|nr:cell division protein FtsQ/DivIB [Kiloniellales bacterium]
MTRELAMRGAAGLAGLVILAGIIGLIGSGWAGRKLDDLADGLGRASAALGLAVDEVFVEGRVRTRPEQLLAAVGVVRGDPIFELDPPLAKSRIEALPWVRRATVERRLPSVIYLRVEERHPMALWQADGRLTVIDESGAVIPGARPEDFAGLTLVVGPDAPTHAAQLLQLLAEEPELSRRVVAAVRVGGRRWNLRFHGGTDVRLPETGAAEAWAQFARIERQHGVLQRDVDSIDLRLPDRLVVRTAPDEDPPKASDDGKNT